MQTLSKGRKSPVGQSMGTAVSYRDAGSPFCCCYRMKMNVMRDWKCFTKQTYSGCGRKLLFFSCLYCERNIFNLPLFMLMQSIVNIANLTELWCLSNKWTVMSLYCELIWGRTHNRIISLTNCDFGQSAQYKCLLSVKMVWKSLYKGTYEEKYYSELFVKTYLYRYLRLNMLMIKYWKSVPNTGQRKFGSSLIHKYELSCLHTEWTMPSADCGEKNCWKPGKI